MARVGTAKTRIERDHDRAARAVAMHAAWLAVTCGSEILERRASADRKPVGAAMRP